MKRASHMPSDVSARIAAVDAVVDRALRRDRDRRAAEIEPFRAQLIAMLDAPPPEPSTSRAPWHVVVACMIAALCCLTLSADRYDMPAEAPAASAVTRPAGHMLSPTPPAVAEPRSHADGSTNTGNRTRAEEHTATHAIAARESIPSIPRTADRSPNSADATTMTPPADTTAAERPARRPAAVRAVLQEGSSSVVVVDTMHVNVRLKVDDGPATAP